MKIFSINNIYKKTLAYILIVSFALFFNFPVKNINAQKENSETVQESENSEKTITSQNITYLSPNIIFELDKNKEQKKDNIIFSDNSFSIPNKVVIDFKNPEDDGDFKNESNGKINYKAQKGDTLDKIAKKFGITVSTIKVENKLTNNSVRVGQNFSILPISGFVYTIRSGDTVSKIAERYGSSKDEIEMYNIFSNSKKIKTGREIIIPVKNYYKEIKKQISKKVVKTSSKVSKKTVNNSPKKTKKYTSPKRIISSGRGYFTNPAPGSVRTQGIHGRNAVDLASIGHKHIPIVAAASGRVTRARRTPGYYGGYGMNIKISHSNGTVTLYAHLSKVIVSEGQYVKKGQVIGYMGNTGRSTGVHLHFEVRNGINPF